MRNGRAIAALTVCGLGALGLMVPRKHFFQGVRRHKQAAANPDGGYVPPVSRLRKRTLVKSAGWMPLRSALGRGPRAAVL
jgi:hypothetical protein